ALLPAHPVEQGQAEVVVGLPGKARALRPAERRMGAVEVAPGRLHADDLGPEPGQEERAVRSRQEAGQVEDDHAVERLHADHRPLNLGSRFSRKARMASAVSSVAVFTDCARPSASSASSMVVVKELVRSRFVIDSASGGPAAKRSGQSATEASGWLAGRPRVAKASPAGSLAEVCAGE